MLRLHGNSRQARQAEQQLLLPPRCFPGALPFRFIPTTLDYPPPQTHRRHQDQAASTGAGAGAACAPEAPSSTSSAAAAGSSTAWSDQT